MCYSVSISQTTRACINSHFFFFCCTPTTAIYTLSLHDALPILPIPPGVSLAFPASRWPSTREATFNSPNRSARSEEHTSELQSRFDLVCRLLLEKKKTLHVLQTTGPYPDTVDCNASPSATGHSK